MTDTDYVDPGDTHETEEPPYAFVQGEGKYPDLVTNPGTANEKIAHAVTGDIEADNPKFSTKKFALQAMLEKAGQVVPTRDVMQVLKNFLVEVTDGKLRVAATDLELSIVVASEMVSVERAGTIVLPAQRMLQIVREADQGDLTIDVEEQTAHVTVGRADWYVKLQSPDDYPALPGEEDLKFSTVDRSAFLRAVATIRHSASRESTRPSLMMLDVTDGRMRAADGVRFMQVKIANVPNMQVPINAVDDLVKILKATEQTDLEIGEDDTSLVFRIGGDEFVAQKPTNTFPDVDEVLLSPALANDQVLSVDNEELAGAIKRVRIMADPETSAVVLDLTENMVTVSAKDKNGSRATEQVDAVWTDKDRTLSFNHVHLAELLRSIEAKNVKMKLGKDTKTRPSPLLIEDDEQGVVAVLNQLRLDWVK